MSNIALRFVSISAMLVPPEQASSALKALALLAHLLLGRIVGGVNGAGVIGVGVTTVDVD